MDTPDLLPILRELVACKQLREEVSRRKQRRQCSIVRDPQEVRAVAALHHECKVREFRAWNAARAALATPSLRNHEETTCNDNPSHSASWCA